MGVHRYREGSCKGLRARLRRSESLFGVSSCHRAAIGVRKSEQTPMFHNHENYKG